LEECNKTIVFNSKSRVLQRPFICKVMGSWVDWFLTQPEAELFIRVNERFIALEADNPENRMKVRHFDEALGILRGRKEEKTSRYDQDARLLYGLVHRQYLSTEDGIAKMVARQKAGLFPGCPRTLCKRFTCVPCAGTEEFHQKNVKMFCPNCTDVYEYESQVPIDGYFFGKDWVHYMMDKYPDIVEGESARCFVPEIFGFKVFLEANKRRT
jgi:casein kinase II subunit beta